MVVQGSLYLVLHEPVDGTFEGCIACKDQSSVGTHRREAQLFCELLEQSWICPP